ncbi:MAG TPA: lysine-2,3-aminomutase-like protein [Crinalium sp.]|jgi:lysine 2,3-aminomutase
MQQKIVPHQTARNSQDLLDAGLISQNQAKDIDQTSENFSMAITPEMMELINPDDPNDPIARQFIPSLEEFNVLPEEFADPIGDEPFTKVKGIVHRYPDRLLLKPLHVCAVYCRFCLRREQVGSDGEGLSPTELEEALDYIRSHSEVWEVILSGGDPLILSKSRLSYIIRALDTIEHVEVIRIHTRVPVVAPSRVDAEMVQALKVKTPVYVVLHANHPRELTEEAIAACDQLVDHGIPMLSQSALLKGINDDPQTMAQLMRRLTRARVKPYYLHHGDLAQGTSHFRTSIEEGQAIMRSLRGDLSGLCQPTYVLDIPGGHGKVPIGPTYLQKEGEGDRYQVEDPWSNLHTYPPTI